MGVLVDLFKLYEGKPIPKQRSFRVENIQNNGFIIFVNSTILSSMWMDFGAVMVATSPALIMRGIFMFGA